MRRVVALLLIAVVVVVGCSDDDKEPAAPTTVPTTTTPPALSQLTRLALDVDRLGPIVVGMTPEEAEEAGGIPLRRDTTFEPCVLLSPADGDGVELYAIDGRIAFIEVGAPVKTAAGIATDDTRDDIETAYPGAHLEGRLNRFGKREIVVTPPGVTGMHFVFIFGDDNVHVERIRTGRTPDVDVRDEGCA